MNRKYTELNQIQGKSTNNEIIISLREKNKALLDSNSVEKLSYEGVRTKLKWHERKILYLIRC